MDSAVILAAGMGRRLKPFTKKIPKVLLDIHGKRIIERIFDDLDSIGVDNVIIVSGFAHDKVKNFIEKIKRNYSFKINFIINREFMNTNTGYSLLLGMREAQGDTIIWNGDVVSVHDNVENIGKTKNSALLVDFDKELTEESYKVLVTNGQLAAMGKELPIEKSAGEYVGISKVSNKDFEKFIEFLKMRVKNNRNCYYDDTFVELAKVSKVELVPTMGFVSEIDFLEDYLKVLEAIE